MTGFQTQVQIQPAPGVEWDFCSTNPRSSQIAGPGAFVAGSSLFLGFAWADPYYQVLNSNGSGVPTGVVTRNWQGLITTFLAESTLQVLPGIQCFCMSEADIWMPNSGTTDATIGMKAYANVANGSQVSFAATGAPPQSFSATGSTIAAETFSFTGSIAPSYNNTGDLTQGILTTSGAITGTIVVGGIISGTGVVTGTQIVSQLTGTPGGAGTYVVSNPTTVASAAISGTYGLFTPGTVTGTINIGDVLSGSGGGGVTAGTTITSAGASAGTYNVQTTQTVTSSTITGTQWVETKWICKSVGVPGEIVKTSVHP